MMLSSTREDLLFLGLTVKQSQIILGQSGIERFLMLSLNLWGSQSISYLPLFLKIWSVYQGSLTTPPEYTSSLFSVSLAHENAKARLHFQLPFPMQILGFLNAHLRNQQMPQKKKAAQNVRIAKLQFSLLSTLGFSSLDYLGIPKFQFFISPNFETVERFIPAISAQYLSLSSYASYKSKDALMEEVPENVRLTSMHFSFFL